MLFFLQGSLKNDRHEIQINAAPIRESEVFPPRVCIRIIAAAGRFRMV